MLHHIDCQFINMEKVSPVFYRKTEPFIPTHDRLKNRYTLSYRYSYYRVGFFIHKGTFSQGCITIPLMDNVEVAKYNRFVEMMESTTPKRITKYIPWRVTICSLGEITVSL